MHMLDYFFGRHGYTLKTDDDARTVHVALPGVDPRQLNLSLAGRALRIQAGEDIDYRILLPDDRCIAEGATADAQHGVLSVRLPFAEARTIPVRVDRGAEDT